MLWTYVAICREFVKASLDAAVNIGFNYNVQSGKCVGVVDAQLMSFPSTGMT